MHLKDFLHNISKKTFVGINELKIHMKSKCAVRYFFCAVVARINLWLGLNLKMREMEVN